MTEYSKEQLRQLKRIAEIDNDEYAVTREARQDPSFTLSNEQLREIEKARRLYDEKSWRFTLKNHNQICKSCGKNIYSSPDDECNEPRHRSYVERKKLYRDQ